jgi:hypothetical protein
MRIVNCTPHTVVVRPEGSDKTITYEPSGWIARVEVSQHPGTPLEDGCPTTYVDYTTTSGTKCRLTPTSSAPCLQRRTAVDTGGRGCSWCPTPGRVLSERWCANSADPTAVWHHP